MINSLLQQEVNSRCHIEIDYRNLNGCISQRFLDVSIKYQRKGQVQIMGFRTFIDKKGIPRCFSNGQFTSEMVSEAYTDVVSDLQDYGARNVECRDLVEHAIIGLEFFGRES